MEKNIIIGVDVSSATLDICIKGNGELKSLVIKNKVAEIVRFLKPFASKKVIIAMENTGRYNWPLYEALSKFSYTVYVIPPLHLKKSLGLSRGKNDKIDAQRILQFITRHYDTLEPWVCPSATIQKLKILLTERNYRVKTKRQLAGMRIDYKKMKSIGLSKPLDSMNKKLIEELDKQILKIEQEMQKLISLDQDLDVQAKLIQTVPGVGKVLCWTMLCKTNGFKSIIEPRKMACYSGVAPFEYQSGTSIFRKPRVSNYADKSLKSVLHLAAMSAIRLNNDLKIYYLRKVEDGKNKMSVLNAVRNKIIHRIYAVIKHQRPYQNHLILS